MSRALFLQGERSSVVRRRLAACLPMAALAALFLLLACWSFAHAATWGPTAISASADDARDNGDSSGFSYTTADLRTRTHSSATSGDYWCAGFRWTPNVPQGATITSATISNLTQYDHSIADIIIYAHDVDNAPDFATTQDVIDRARTSASVSWQDASVTFPATSPDISSVIQEIVDRPGWSAGNGLVILFIARLGGSGRVYFNSYDTGAANAAKLTIEYTTASNSPPTLTVDEPDGSGDTVTVGDNFTIQYDLADSDDTVTVDFYYDTNNSGLDGTLITGDCEDEPEATNGTCTWDTTGMTQGTYYVYGVTSDGTNPDVTDYSPGQVTIQGDCFTVRGKATGTGTTTSVTVNKPSGTVEGDLMVATVTHDKYDGDLSAPAGWTLIQPSTHLGDDHRTRSWYKVAGASEPGSYTFTWNGSSDNLIGHITTFAAPSSGTWTLEDSSYKAETSSSTQSITTNSVTAVDGGILYTAFSHDSADTVATPPSAMVLDNFSSTSLSLATYWACSAAGSVTKTITWAGTDDQNAIAAVFSFSGGSSSPDLTQTHYRWRNDDGTESSGGTLTVNAGHTVYNSYDHGGSITDHVITTPTHSQGDTIYIAFVCDGGGQSITWPSGFTTVYAADDIESTATWGLAYKVAGASEPASYTVTISSAERAVAIAWSVSNADGIDAYSSTNGGSGTTATCNATTTTQANDLVFRIVANDYTSLTHSTISGYTMLDQEGLDSGGTISVQYITQASAGSTGTADVTLSQTEEWGSATVAVKPAAGGTAATFALAEDAKIGIQKGDSMRLRLLVSNEGTASSGAVTYQLQVAETGTCSSGTYSAVGGSTGAGAHWDMAASSYITDAESTQNVSGGLTDPSGGSFVAGQLKDTGDTTAGITLAADEFTEIEYSVAPTAAATTGGEYCFRLYDTTAGSALDTYSVYGQAKVLAATAVELVSFTAEGAAGGGVQVSWATAQETSNKGFHLYRSGSPAGPWQRLNPLMIPAAAADGRGAGYGFLDQSAVFGQRYYYRLADVEAGGAVSFHGPICVDWDADGMPDDWEAAGGLDPLADDAAADADGDGLSNIDEYRRGTDPHAFDTDGDGVADGAERKQPEAEAAPRVVTGPGVELVAADEAGISLELVTGGFELVDWQQDGGSYERLSIPEYVHGYSSAAGRPQVPVKGLWVAIPAGSRPELTVVAEEAGVHPGYRLYPAPAYEPLEGGGLREVFFYDQQAYGAEGFVPAAAAELGDSYLFRGQRMQQVRFYPIGFNAAEGAILLRNRIRVRIDYGNSAPEQAEEVPPEPWRPPASGVARSLWSPPAAGGYQLLVSEAGIYRIDADWLAAQGLSEAEIAAIDLQQAALYHLGREVALWVVDQNGDGRLQQDDFILFYGQPVAEAYAKYARYNVYWLMGSGGGRRMDTADATPGQAGLSAWHWHTEHYEEDQLYLLAARGEDGIDRWVFSQVAFGQGFAHPAAGQPAQFVIEATDVAEADGAALTIRLYSPHGGEHSAEVALNGVPVGTIGFSGIGYHTASFENLTVAEGANSVSVTCTSGEDRLIFDWFELSYRRGYAAEGDRLSFTHEDGWQYAAGGFGSDRIWALEVSQPQAPLMLEGGQVTGAGPFGLRFEPPAEGRAAAFALSAEGALRRPAGLRRPAAVGLVEDTGADWILITSAALGWDAQGAERGWLSDLLALRQAGGLRTAAVSVEALYDGFSYGIESPQAIKDFIAHAYSSWPAPAPQYVLLVGDASYDVKDNWGLGTVSHVPGYLIFTEYFGETATDQWYVQVCGADALPDLSIGRLPAADAEQAAAMAAKIIAYEQAANTKGWEKAVLVAADNALEDYEVIFEQIGEGLAERVPAAMGVPQRFYLGEYEQELLSAADLSADLMAAINTGALVVAYAGHSSYSMWATEGIWDERGPRFREDSRLLTNAGKYPLVVSMSCLSGYFLYPEAWTALYNFNFHSIGEALIRPATAGAVAALVPTGMTTPEGQKVLAEALFEQLFTQDRRTVGDALLQARLALLANTDGDFRQVSDTFLLFGDPATPLKVPLPRRPAGLSATGDHAGAVSLAWQPADDCHGQPVAGYRVYRRAAGQSAWQLLSAEPVATTAFTDTTAAADTLYYYAVTSVDADGEESVKSVAVTPAAPAANSDPSPLSSAGCFITTAAF